MSYFESQRHALNLKVKKILDVLKIKSIHRNSSKRLIGFGPLLREMIGKSTLQFLLTF